MNDGRRGTRCWSRFRALKRPLSLPPLTSMRTRRPVGSLAPSAEQKAVKRTVAPLSRTDQKPEAPPTTFTPAAKTNGSAAPPTQPAAEPVTRDAIDESPEALDTRCQELMNKVRFPLWDSRLVFSDM